MGTRGPIPKRSNEGHPTAQRRKRRNGVEVAKFAPATVNDVQSPDPNPEWSTVPRMMWDAARGSLQNRWYEPTDWAQLYMLCDQIEAHYATGMRNGQMLSSVLSGLGSLMFTEGDRRRIGLELQRATEEQLESPGVTAMKDLIARKAAGGK